MKTSIILLLLAIAYAAYCAPSVVNVNQPIVVFKYPDGKHRMILNLLKGNKQDEASSLTERTLYANEPIMTVFPNPVDNEAEIRFELSKDANVELWATDNINQISLFNGNLTKGKQLINCNFSDFRVGLVVIYLKVDGKYFITKVIKA